MEFQVISWDSNDIKTDDGLVFPFICLDEPSPVNQFVAKRSLIRTFSLKCLNIGAR